MILIITSDLFKNYSKKEGYSSRGQSIENFDKIIQYKFRP